MQIRGGTDGSLIGNTSDRLNVSAFIRPTTLPTYAAGFSWIVDNSATDVLTISGSATKTIRIYRIIFFLTSNNSKESTLNGVRRSSLNTGGTFTLLTNVPHHTVNPAATAVVKAYTQNPSALGSTVGNLIVSDIFVSGSANTASVPYNLMLDSLILEPITLVGLNELFAINLNSESFSNNLARATLFWTED